MIPDNLKIELTEFSSRITATGKLTELTWAELIHRLSSPIVTDETLDAYRAMTNEQRTNVKDVGGFVGGKFEGGKRAKKGLLYRTILTLDADEAKTDDAEYFGMMTDYVFFAHTTHTSTPEKPRMRWIFPLTRPVNAQEYRALANIMCGMVGADTIDETTDQPERLMFWPSVCSDVQFKSWHGGSEVINPDTMLADVDIEDEPAVTAPRTVTETVSVEEGSRNKTVFAFAAGLRAKGLDYKGIRDMTAIYNESYCNPPLPDTELDTICHSVCRSYSPGEALPPSLRDIYDDFKDIGKPSARDDLPKITALKAETFAELCAREVKPPRYLVDNIMTTGLTLFAAPPKFGKSWMSMDLAISVSTGTEFLNQPTHQCPVAYLCLEDGDYRLRSRGLKVAGKREISDQLYLIKEAPNLGTGLLDRMQEMRDEKGIGLFILDTFQKIRGEARRNEGVYAYDYREVSALHNFAINNDLAIALIHHTRKGSAVDSDDFINLVNGSQGIPGACDSIIVMDRGKRGGTDALFKVTGRDVVEHTMAIRMNWSTYRWEYLGEEKDVAQAREELEFEADPVVKTILYYLDEAEDLSAPGNRTASWHCSSGDMLTAVRNLFGAAEYRTASAVATHVQKLEKRLESICGISYEYVADRKLHVFTRAIL